MVMFSSKVAVAVSFGFNVSKASDVLGETASGNKLVGGGSWRMCLGPSVATRSRMVAVALPVTMFSSRAAVALSFGFNARKSSVV